MNFIMGLSTSEGCNWVFVVVDRYSKYATFNPTPKECSTEKAPHLFLKHVVKYWACLLHCESLGFSLYGMILDRVVQAYGVQA